MKKININVHFVKYLLSICIINMLIIQIVNYTYEIERPHRHLSRDFEAPMTFLTTFMRSKKI